MQLSKYLQTGTGPKTSFRLIASLTTHRPDTLTVRQTGEISIVEIIMTFDVKEMT